MLSNCKSTFLLSVCFYLLRIFTETLERASLAFPRVLSVGTHSRASLQIPTPGCFWNTHSLSKWQFNIITMIKIIKVLHTSCSTSQDEERANFQRRKYCFITIIIACTLKKKKKISQPMPCGSYFSMLAGEHAGRQPSCSTRIMYMHGKNLEAFGKLAA